MRSEYAGVQLRRALTASRAGGFMSRYKSGKLPRAITALPTSDHWEELLVITNPDAWTPNAVYEATRVFVSAKSEIAQVFMEMVLLPRVRDDIHEHKKLNGHLFKALRKGLFKPAAWFKGFLFPFAASGTCTIREAQIIAGVLTRQTIPMIHGATALESLCDIAAEQASQGTEGGGATNILIRTLLEKRYALPFSVIDSLVFHFLRFRSVDPASVPKGQLKNLSDEKAAMQRNLPVLWHQCLLAFVKTYKNDISEEQVGGHL
jgi:essential nuclear protein 1